MKHCQAVQHPAAKKLLFSHCTYAATLTAVRLPSTACCHHGTSCCHTLVPLPPLGTSFPPPAGALCSCAPARAPLRPDVRGGVWGLLGASSPLLLRPSGWAGSLLLLLVCVGDAPLCCWAAASCCCRSLICGQQATKQIAGRSIRVLHQAVATLVTASCACRAQKHHRQFLPWASLPPCPPRPVPQTCMYVSAQSTKRLTLMSVSYPMEWLHDEQPPHLCARLLQLLLQHLCVEPHMHRHSVLKPTCPGAKPAGVATTVSQPMHAASHHATAQQLSTHAQGNTPVPVPTPRLQPTRVQGCVHTACDKVLLCAV